MPKKQKIASDALYYFGRDGNGQGVIVNLDKYIRRFPNGRILVDGVEYTKKALLAREDDLTLSKYSYLLYIWKGRHLIPELWQKLFLGDATLNMCYKGIRETRRNKAV